MITFPRCKRYDGRADRIDFIVFLLPLIINLSRAVLIWFVSEFRFTSVAACGK